MPVPPFHHWLIRNGPSAAHGTDIFTTHLASHLEEGRWYIKPRGQRKEIHYRVKSNSSGTLIPPRLASSGHSVSAHSRSAPQYPSPRQRVEGMLPLSRFGLVGQCSSMHTMWPCVLSGSEVTHTQRTSLHAPPAAPHVNRARPRHAPMYSTLP